MTLLFCVTSVSNPKNVRLMPAFCPGSVIGAVTAKVTPLLTPVPIVTTMGPLEAPVGTAATIWVGLQLVTVVAATPLNVTVPPTWVAPKFRPVISTEVPTGPDVGEILPMLGPGLETKKFAPLLATPETVTITFPVVAPVGTIATTLVEVQEDICVAGTPLKVTLLVPCVDPKFTPVMVTAVPTEPNAGEMLAMLGTTVTVKLTPLLATPKTVTTTLPEVAPLGTGTVMLVALQLVGDAAVPLKVTVLVPCVEPKFTPVIVTDVPTAPNVGDKPVMLGAATTVNATPLLAIPETVTTTFPVVAPFGTGTTILVPLQLVGVAATPLNVTVLVPCVPPKFVPVMVTELLTEPDVIDRLVMLGVGATVNRIPLLATPPTLTTTLPEVAPVGTKVTMLVELQLVGVAVVPLKVTELVP
jgi:hypothetical protein